MSFDAQTLYSLLPSVYRIRDNEQGGLLKELLQVIAEQIAVLEEDLDQLYDDQFIETCAQWVVSYIGDLVGYRDLNQVSSRIGTSRAEVANTIAFRRRKGTAAMLEQLARDVTGWDAAVVEFFQRLATSQYLKHVRLQHHGAVDLRRWDKLAYIGSPFDDNPHSIDVRRISSGRGYYNILNIGIFLWRIQSYSLTESPAVAIDARRFRFNPLGIDMPLYNRPVSETLISHLATPENVPIPLKRRYLSAHLREHYGSGRSFYIRRGESIVDFDQIKICDLSDTGSGQWGNMPATGVAVDPQLGRIAFSEDINTVMEPIQVTFRYGFTADLGSGEYDRATSLSEDSASAIRVPDDEANIQAAIDTSGGSGVVEISNSGRYEETLQIHVSENRLLEVQSANYSRPTVVLNDQLVISGGDSAELVINGLLISGNQLRIPAQVNGESNRLQRLCLRHCTLVPGISLLSDGTPQQLNTRSLIVEAANVTVEIENCIIGGIQADSDSKFYIKDSIVDALSPSSIAFSSGNTDPGGSLKIDNSTIVGEIYARETPLISNCIFTSPVYIEHIQKGCVRYSYLSLNSHVPRRYRCQPEEEIANGSIQPSFTSLRYGDEAYYQLRNGCRKEISEGADDESEMGVYHNLYQPQRENNVNMRLREYLRFGLEAGVFYAS